MALVPIQILGSRFSLRSDDQDPQYLERVIQLFEKKILEVQDSVAVSDPLKVAIITGIILTEELMKEKQKSPTPTAQAQPEALDEIERITRSLIHTIEEVL